jgi:preprotein translocase subunit SecA
MTGTAATESEEFKKIYNLDVITIPTQRSIQRTDYQDLIFKSQRSKYTAIVNHVEQLHKLGQPVLIGTTSIQKNEIISSLLAKKSLPYQVLNAKNHQAEAEIIAKAGKFGAITVATNMAGRGVDIILGGPKEGIDLEKWQKDHDKIISLGGLYVVGTERHESRRIDNQLRGRAGRQGDPGVSQFYVALDDDLMRIFGGEKISGLMTRFNMPDDAPLTHPLVSKIIEQIQVKVEGFNFDARKNLVEYDDVINKQRKIIYSLRDLSLYNGQFSIDNNWKEVNKYLSSEINFIMKNGVETTDNSINFEKVALEFSEIFPMDDDQRQKIKKQLQNEPNPNEFLTKTIEDQWKQRLSYFGKDIANSILTYAVITTLDPLWVEHLTALDDLRSGVRLRGYAQKDPLIEYRKEGYEMFQKLMRQFEYNLARKIFRLEPVSMPTEVVPETIVEGRGDINDDNQVENQLSISKSSTPVNKPTIGRNDPCPCGSGKKYKKCCYPKFG